jgi:hypothetical protein
MSIHTIFTNWIWIYIKLTRIAWVATQNKRLSGGFFCLRTTPPIRKAMRP